jgi:hypothetical protein
MLWQRFQLLDKQAPRATGAIRAKPCIAHGLIRRTGAGVSGTATAPS